MVDYEALERKLGGEVEEHEDGGDEVLVPHQILSQPIAEPGAGGSEYQIIECYKRHGTRYVRVGMEGVFTVKGEVPNHR